MLLLLLMVVVVVVVVTTTIVVPFATIQITRKQIILYFVTAAMLLYINLAMVSMSFRVARGFVRSAKMLETNTRNSKINSRYVVVQVTMQPTSLCGALQLGVIHFE
jgi:hypothetical protein